MEDSSKYLADEVARLMLLQRNEDEQFRDAAILAIAQGWVASSEDVNIPKAAVWICDFADALLAERNRRRDERQKGGA